MMMNVDPSTAGFWENGKRSLSKGKKLKLLLESSGDMSNFYEHCEAVVNFERTINSKADGQYRKKKQ